MRAVLLAALYAPLFSCVAAPVGAQDSSATLPGMFSSELMAKAVVPGHVAAVIGPIALAPPSYSLVRHTDAWRAPESGQEIRVDELRVQAYLRKHPQLTFRMTGTFAQRDTEKTASGRSFSTYGQRQLEREKKLSIGGAYRF